jgi:DNA-directed RNA polymerase specialized sigma24 family protein
VPANSQPDLFCGNNVFATTHWSVVLAAADIDSPKADIALAELCRTYWYPLYAYVRRRGYAEHDAQDLTQGFFVHLIERHSIRRVAREKGRFRSFLLASLNYFLADERDRASAEKRGGRCEIISFNAEEAEQRYRLEPVDNRDPEKIFEHRWAMTLLDQVLDRLKGDFARAGKAEFLMALQPFLVEGAGEQPYSEAALESGMSEEAFKKAVQRMRQRYYQLFREVIAQTVAIPAEVEDELRHLCAVVSSWQQG